MCVCVCEEDSLGLHHKYVYLSCSCSNSRNRSCFSFVAHPCLWTACVYSRRSTDLLFFPMKQYYYYIIQAGRNKKKNLFKYKHRPRMMVEFRFRSGRVQIKWNYTGQIAPSFRSMYVRFIDSDKRTHHASANIISCCYQNF